jgi:hypothetical protein
VGNNRKITDAVQITHAFRLDWLLELGQTNRPP